MPQFGMPRGFGVFGGANGKSSCYKSIGQQRSTSCNTLSCKGNTSKCERVSRRTEQNLIGCKSSFMDCDSNMVVCGKNVRIIGWDNIDIRANGRMIHIDGKQLRCLLRQTLIDIQPVPISDNPNDFVIWKSQMDDLVGGTYTEEECAKINNVITHFLEIFSTKINASSAGDVWDQFINSGDEILNLLIDNGVSYKSSFCNDIDI